MPFPMKGKREEGKGTEQEQFSFSLQKCPTKLPESPRQWANNTMQPYRDGESASNAESSISPFLAFYVDELINRSLSTSHSKDSALICSSAKTHNAAIHNTVIYSSCPLLKNLGAVCACYMRNSKESSSSE
uniref:Uncharacterized protein n=1 Tax=Ascaris lumbricoides TaxID=6252 RepID=A0A0M3IRC9_ASCLU